MKELTGKGKIDTAVFDRYYTAILSAAVSGAPTETLTEQSQECVDLSLGFTDLALRAREGYFNGEENEQKDEKATESPKHHPLVLIKDTLRHEVEKRTNGDVTVLYDDRGIPSYMLRVPQFDVEAVDSAFGKGVHPAFIVGERQVAEIFVGLTPATLINGLAYSLPEKEWTCSINFDTARESCTKKGKGWHLLNNWEWAALVMFLTKNNFSHFEKSWWEWTDGLKLVDGKFYFPNTNDFGKQESEWEYQDVALDDIHGLPVLSADVTNYTENERNKNGNYTHITEIAELKKTDSYNSLPVNVREQFARLLIDPVATSIFSKIENNDIFVRNYGERLPFRGGSWDNGASVGLAALSLSLARSNVNIRPRLSSRFCWNLKTCALET